MRLIRRRGVSVRRRAAHRGARCDPWRPWVGANRLLLAVATVAVLSVLMSVHFLPSRVTLKIGDRSPSDVRAPRSVAFVDSRASERLRVFAADAVTPVYQRDASVVADANHTTDAAFDAIRRAVREGRTQGADLDRLIGEVGSVLSRDILQQLVRLPERELNLLQTTARRLVDSTLQGEIRESTGDLQRARHSFEAEASRVALGPLELSVLKALGQRTIRPNFVVDHAQTRNRRDSARRSVEPVVGEIRAGEVVIRQGEVFTQLHLDKCTALGLVNPRLSLPAVVAIVALATAMVATVGLHVRRAHPTLYSQPRLLFLLAAIVISSVFGLKLFGALLGVSLSVVQIGYLGMMMVVAAGMLIAVLVGPALAVLIVSLLAVLSGLMINHEVRFPVMTLISSLVGIYGVVDLRDRTHLLRWTLVLGAVNVGLVWVLGGLLGDSLSEVVTGSAWALMAALFAAPLFWLGVALLERPFGAITHISLLELSSTERPLLRDLCLSAPGTYAHSIMVGNLAEAAAEAVGADRLLCRVASYYHDIGKVQRPHCFVENQRGENIHDRLNASLSALIIAAHVRDGVALAEEHRLPRQITQCIAEHHGNSLIGYFYQQAVQGLGNGHSDPILEQHFRYDGPRPQRKESGIIMLADSVEAAARCLDKPSVPRLQSLVESIVHDKLVDGQLDECDLTLKDLRLVRGAFVRVLGAMLHGRITYPATGRVFDAVAQAGVPQGTEDAGVRRELAAAPAPDEAPASGRASHPPSPGGSTR